MTWQVMVIFKMLRWRALPPSSPLPFMNRYIRHYLWPYSAKSNFYKLLCWIRIQSEYIVLLYTTNYCLIIFQSLLQVVLNGWYSMCRLSVLHCNDKFWSMAFLQLVHHIPEAGLNYQSVPPSSSSTRELDQNSSEHEQTTNRPRARSKDEVRL